jgi:arylsulfatase A-like enzyme
MPEKPIETLDADTQDSRAAPAASAGDNAAPTASAGANAALPTGAGASDRRTFIRRGLWTAGSLLLGPAGLADLTAARAASAGAERDPRGGTARAHAPRHPGPRRSEVVRRPPNILVIVVDQLRAPVWLPPAVSFSALMPNLAALRRGAVSFERHYTAANDCTPARGALVTGLHSHQTGCMITGDSRLNPGFPTWGTLLRELGYATTWWGKWHLNPDPNASLQPYGFAGGTYPSPNGSPGQGLEADPEIAGQFAEWFGEAGGVQPWCATVSFVNPHDIAWWYRFTEQIPQESSPPALAAALPPNFETPQALEGQSKPQLQRSLQDTAARSFGRVPFAGPEALGAWTGLMNTYLMLQSYVDRQIGAVLAALATRPATRAQTVVLFTSDHGEYGGSHGLRGKGAGAYEEAIRVPLYVRDFRGVATAAPAVGRSQLTSSVDVVPLLLSLATGSNAWRGEARYEHLVTRHDLAAICAHPSAAGRRWVLHATDEDVTEFASEPYAAEAPRHVVALRTAQGKLGVYSNWAPQSTAMQSAGQEVELYDYSTPAGRAELVNAVGASPLEDGLWSTLEAEALPQELHAALPTRLRAAQRHGLGNYLAVEERQELKVYVSHQTAPVPSEPQPTPD